MIMKTDIQISESDIYANSCIDFVQSDEAGGHVIFIGTVRNHTKGKKVIRLEFESYEPMAIKEITKITKEIESRWPQILSVSIHHRVGNLEIGEIPVIIAVSSAHRKKAFEACEYAIDRLKEKVPIWKKEIFEDGEVWVAAHP